MNHLLWKLPLATVAVGAVVAVAARELLPQVPLARVLLGFALLMLVVVVLAGLYAAVMAAFHQFSIRRGASDPAWLKFGDEPPGLKGLRRRSKRHGEPR